jgi:signal transduction histidine kinase
VAISAVVQKPEGALYLFPDFSTFRDALASLEGAGISSGADRIDIHACDEGRQVVFYVRDNGRGINQATRERVS